MENEREDGVGGGSDHITRRVNLSAKTQELLF